MQLMCVEEKKDENNSHSRNDKPTVYVYTHDMERLSET